MFELLRVKQMLPNVLVCGLPDVGRAVISDVVCVCVRVCMYIYIYVCVRVCSCVASWT
jgi:hypothetical protein